MKFKFNEPVSGALCEVDLYEKSEMFDVQYPPTLVLTPREEQVLVAAKAANAWWFRIILIMASIMVERRFKYAGSRHPFFNFFDTAQRTNQKEGEGTTSAYLTAVQYESMKESRAAVTGNVEFTDESPLDTALDNLNYGVLKTALKFFEFDISQIL